MLSFFIPPFLKEGIDVRGNKEQADNRRNWDYHVNISLFDAQHGGDGLHAFHGIFIAADTQKNKENHFADPCDHMNDQFTGLAGF